MSCPVSGCPFITTATDQRKGMYGHLIGGRHSFASTIASTLADQAIADATAAISAEGGSAAVQPRMHTHDPDNPVVSAPVDGHGADSTHDDERALLLAAQQRQQLNAERGLAQLIGVETLPTCKKCGARLYPGYRQGECLDCIVHPTEMIPPKGRDVGPSGEIVFTLRF